MRDENGELIYSYNDEYIRGFVSQNIKVGRCSSFNQKYNFSVSVEVFNIISTELKGNGNICENLDKFSEITNKHGKILEDEYDSQFEGYRDINKDESEEYVNDKLRKLSIHEKLKT